MTESVISSSKSNIDESKKINFWKNMEKKGFSDKKIQEIFDKYYIRLLDIYDSESSIFADENNFTAELNESIETDLMAKLSKLDLSDDKIQTQIKKFKYKTFEKFDLVFRKKALCMLNIDAYIFFKYLDAISKTLDNGHFIISENSISITEMDNSHIALVHLNIVPDSTNKLEYKFLKSARIGICFTDFKNIMKVTKSSQTSAKVIFCEKKIFIKLKSNKFSTIINRVLPTIYLEFNEDIDLNSLNKLNFNCNFSMTKQFFEHIENSLDEKFSDVFDINSSPKQIIFSQNGISKNEIILTENNLTALSFNKKKTKKETKKEEDEIGFSNTYAIDLFNSIKYIIKTIEPLSSFRFFQAFEIPLKIEIPLKEMGKSSITYFIAGRVEEDDDDEDEDYYIESESQSKSKSKNGESD